MDEPLFSCDKDFLIYEGTGVTSSIFPFQFKNSYVFPLLTRPPRPLKRDKFFWGTHRRFIITKNRMV